MRIAFAFATGFGLFATGFALHIIGGVADIEGLFQFAVVWILISALGFPATVLTFAGVSIRTRLGLAVLTLAFVCGYALTLATLWAANDRAFAPWQFPASAILVAGVSLLKLLLDLMSGGRSLHRSRPRA